MTNRSTYYPFKVEVPLNRCESLDESENLHSKLNNILETVKEIVEGQYNEYSVRVADSKMIFWFKQERHAILMILRCS